MPDGHLRLLDEDLRAKKEPGEAYLILLGCMVWPAIVALFFPRNSPGPLQRRREQRVEGA